MQHVIRKNRVLGLRRATKPNRLHSNLRAGTLMCVKRATLMPRSATIRKVSR